MINKLVDIAEDQELRLQVKGGEQLEIKLVEGSAEILGTELAPQRIYHFNPLFQTVYPIYTWNGCTISVSQEKEPPYANYISSKNRMPMILSYHVCLEKCRSTNKKGPTVMIAGKNNSGKNSICKILCNYAIRDGRTPIFVDVDIVQNTISIPGSIGAAIINCQTSVENEEMSEDSPLVYNFGTMSHNKNNLPLYKQILSEMVAKIEDIKKNNRKVATSGLIINTGNEGYHLLLLTAQILEVDVMIVIGDKELYNDLNVDIPFVNIVFLSKSDGIIERKVEEKKLVSEDKIRRYFYGRPTRSKPHSLKLQPHNIQIPFHATKIYDISSSKVHSVPITLKLKNKLLAVSFASKKSDLRSSHIAGYVCVIAVDEESKMMTLLSPEPELTLGNLLILTNLILST